MTEYWYKVFVNLCKVIRKREDVYRVIKAFENRGEWLGPEAKRYVQCLVCKVMTCVRLIV